MMDRSSDTTDAYVEVKLGNITHKTDVFRKSLNPQWNSEWFRFEVHDLELQDEPLQIRLMDHDTYSANDAIGKVYVDLNPLLLPPLNAIQAQRHAHEPTQPGRAEMSGWLPVYDTMHGIRGEVNIIVKVDLFSDFNKFRQSSCGVQFFFTPGIPVGHRCQNILGFVEELVVNDDPEYQWIDKIRTPRASNEARQTLFSKLSGELQRRIGLKVLELGGNAVIGYRQCFDLEGESGIVVRGLGSAVTLVRLQHDSHCSTGGGTMHSPSPLRDIQGQRDLDLLVEARPASASMMDSPKRVGHSRSRHTSGHYPISRSPLPIENLAAAVEVKDSAVNGGVTSSPTHSGKISSPHRSSQSEAIKRGSSDSDLSITPKGSPNPTSGSIAGSGGSSICGVRGGPMPTGAHRPVMTQESFDMLEYPFLTMKSFPEGFIMHLGGTVSARSVKSLDRPHNQEEAETRDNWWTQIRMEIRSHSRALACNIVLGYEEFTTISDEVCVLNATGTAAVINLSHLDNDTANNSGYATRNPRDPMTFSLEKKDLELKDPPQSAGKTSTCKESHMGSQGIMSRSHGGMESDLSPATEAGTTSGSVAAGGGSSGGVVAAGGSSSGGGVAAGGSSSGGGVVAGGSSSGGGSSGGTTAGLIGSGGIVSGPLTTPNQTQQQTQVPYSPCQLCHVPYSETSLPFKVKITKCAICRRGKVPDVLFTTLEPPPNIPITGRGCLIQARVSRQKRDLRGELNAKEISDSLPFLEYELHKQLVNKMKIKGMNALFGLRVRVTVGERLIIGIATATAVFLSALQPPPVPKVTSHGLGRDDERRRMDAQKLLQTTIDRNKECYGTKNVISEITVDEMNGSRGSDTEDSEDDLPEIDLSSGNKETCVLELDDLEDAEMIGLLLGSCNPNSLTAVSTERPPGLPTEQIVTNLQMFTRVWRTKVPTNLNPAIFNLYFDKLMQSIYFKVRKLSPCILAGLKFDCELPEEDEIQIAILGMVLGQGPPSSQQPLANHQRHERHGSRDHQHKKAKQEDSDMIFNMEEVVHSTEEMGKSKPSTQSLPGMLHSAKTANRSLPYSGGHSGPPSGASSTRSSIKSKGGEQRITNYHCIPREHYGVEISPLSFIPGARIERHLGNLNFFFIRESTSIKEAGGLSGFMGSFVTEVLALVRAHVAALGGNAMISYFMSECVLLHNPYKNQGQCLINIGGDVVQVSYSSATTGTAFADTSAVEE